MQTIEIKIADKKNTDFIIELLNKFPFVKEIKMKTQENQKISSQKRSGKPSVDDFAGLWADNPKSLEQIRKKAWDRKL